MTHVNFKKHLLNYTNVLSLLAKQVKSKSKLLDWETKYQNLILLKKTCLNKQDLITIMSWKLSRGKSRPLLHLIQSNQDSQIQDISKSALEAPWPDNLKKIQ